MIKKLVAILLLAISGLAFGQSSPGIQRNATYSPAQWNGFFSAKLDFKPTDNIGQFITGSLDVSAIRNLTSDLTSNVIAITLTTGDWDVQGIVNFSPGASTSYTVLDYGISKTAGTFEGQDTFNQFSTAAVVSGAITQAFSTPVVRINVVSPISVYLVARATFTVSNMGAYGTIRARKVATASSTVAKNLLLSGPLNGLISAPSTPFTVSGDGTLTGVTVATPSSTSGTFNPTTTTISNSIPSATFVYTPNNVPGINIINLSNNSGLTNPPAWTYNSLPLPATTITNAGPISGTLNVASTPFTIGANGSIVGNVIVTPSVASGTLTPATTAISNGNPTNSFTYTPNTLGPNVISFANNGGLINPANVTYQATAANATTITASGPASGTVNVASTPFTIGANGAITGTVTVTPSGTNGTFSPTTVGINNVTPTKTSVFTPTAIGTSSITFANNGSLTNPSALSYQSLGPDMIIVPGSIVFAPSAPTTGQAVAFTATVRNQGAATTPAGLITGVLFSVDGIATNWARTYTTAIPAGASVVLTADGGTAGATWASTLGAHTITALVNDTTRYPESNTANNSLTANLTVIAPPDTTAPTVPTNLIATPISSSQISLSWTASTDNVGVTGYFVYRNGTQIANVTTGTSYQDTGLTASTLYSYTLAAYDAVPNVSAQSGATTATTQPTASVIPTVPQNLTATAVSSSQINLSWSLSTYNGPAPYPWYHIFKNGASYDFVDVLSYSDNGFGAGLPASTLATYTVSAYTPTNESAQSTSASATTQAPIPDTTAPSVPTNVTATAVSNSQINLTWTASTDNIAVVGYRIFRGGVQVASVTNGTSYQDTGLTGATLYSYRIAAYDAVPNVSAQSTAVTATTQAGGGGAGTLHNASFVPALKAGPARTGAITLAVGQTLTGGSVDCQGANFCVKMANNSTIDGVEITNAQTTSYGAAIDMNTASNATVINSWIHNTGADGLMCNTDNGPGMSNNLVQDNRFDHLGGDALHFKGTNADWQNGTWIPASQRNVGHRIIGNVSVCAWNCSNFSSAVEFSYEVQDGQVDMIINNNYADSVFSIVGHIGSSQLGGSGFTQVVGNYVKTNSWGFEIGNVRGMKLNGNTFDGTPWSVVNTGNTDQQNANIAYGSAANPDKFINGANTSLSINWDAGGSTWTPPDVRGPPF